MKEKALSAMPYFALLMLGLSASHGVYQFGLLYVSPLFALITAAAFELTYIGLSVITVATDKSQHKATLVARGAMFVSVAYNVISGYLHRNPIDRFDIWVEVAFAFLHGAPLAVVGYFLATLLLHTTKESANSTTITLQKGKQGKKITESKASDDESSVKVERKEPLALPDLSASSTDEKRNLARKFTERGYTQGEIGESLGLTRQRVGQLLKEEAKV